MKLDPNNVYVITEGKNVHEMRFLGDCDWYDEVVMSLPFLNKIDMNECCYIIPKGATWVVNGFNVMTSLEEMMEGYKPVVQVENKWILCSERLPKKSGQYLTFCKELRYSKITSFDVDTGLWMSLFDVVGWIALPEVPDIDEQ